MEDCYMPDYFNSSHNKISPELQGSVLRGILGSVTGIIVCILVMLLCALFQMSSFSTMLDHYRLALLLVIDLSAVSMVDRSAIIIVMLAAMGMGIVYLWIGKVCRVEVNGEQMRVVSRFGRAAEFSVRDVSSVSRSLGWIVLYDREFKILAKVDSYLEDMERLKEYMASYGIKM